jgi:hypothetical protein
MVESLFSPCGIDCGNCEWFKGTMEPKCAGCNAVKGIPFWGKCETYSCTQSHQVDHCGLCEEFTCREFMKRFDPREGPANALMRAGVLCYRAKYGDREALELLKQAEGYEKPE